MTSSFTWLDYSEHERRKMLDVIEMFGERTTRDELGIGGVRDAFADLLFPGTSTIQTAAKYFLFVPWIYLSLEQKHTPSSKVAERARKLEVLLAQELENSGETDGVIGRFAKERLQRLPSSVYWQGLQQWGIRRFSGSQDAYHRSLDTFYERRRRYDMSRSEFEGESAERSGQLNWHAVPEIPEDFPEGATLDLSTMEAEYLRERILTSCPQSLLAWLVRERISVNGIQFAWQLPGNLPVLNRSQVQHGQNFSEVLHGAQLIYNLMLAEKRSWSEKVDQYQETLKAWWQLIESRRTELAKWKLTEFWQIVRQSNPRIHPRAEQFISDWIHRVGSASSLSILLQNGSEARQQIGEREVWLKRGLARLKNDLACKMWNGAAGASQLDLRWNSARRLLYDMLVEVESTIDA